MGESRRIGQRFVAIDGLGLPLDRWPFGESISARGAFEPEPVGYTRQCNVEAEEVPTASPGREVCRV